VGNFSERNHYFDDQRWEWSERVQRMHGYQPGAVTPTTELMLSHKHSRPKFSARAASTARPLERRPEESRGGPINYSDAD